MTIVDDDDDASSHFHYCDQRADIVSSSLTNPSEQCERRAVGKESGESTRVERPTKARRIRNTSAGDTTSSVLDSTIEQDRSNCTNETTASLTTTATTTTPEPLAALLGATTGSGRADTKKAHLSVLSTCTGAAISSQLRMKSTSNSQKYDNSPPSILAAHTRSQLPFPDPHYKQKSHQQQPQQEHQQQKGGERSSGGERRTVKEEEIHHCLKEEEQEKMQGDQEEREDHSVEQESDKGKESHQAVEEGGGGGGNIEGKEQEQEGEEGRAEDRSTYLFELIGKKQWNIVKEVLRSPKSLSLCQKRDDTNLTCLSLAVGLLAPLDIITDLVQVDPALVTVCDKYGATVLHTGCLNGAPLEVIDFLLSKCQGLATKLDCEKKSPLYYAVDYACRQICKDKDLEALNDDGSASATNENGNEEGEGKNDLGEANQRVNVTKNEHDDNVKHLEEALNASSASSANQNSDKKKGNNLGEVNQRVSVTKNGLDDGGGSHDSKTEQGSNEEEKSCSSKSSLGSDFPSFSSSSSMAVLQRLCAAAPELVNMQDVACSTPIDLVQLVKASLPPDSKERRQLNEIYRALKRTNIQLFRGGRIEN